MARYDFEIVPDVFASTQPATGTRSTAQTLPRFGLLEGDWAALSDRLEELNNNESGAVYKLLYFHRHGQGVHNEQGHKRGYEAWITKWARLPGDGQVIWENAELTPLGQEQARELNAKLKGETKDGMPAPTAFYSSPLIRTLSTLQLVWEGLIRSSTRPKVTESLREAVNAIFEKDGWEDVIRLPKTEAATKLQRPYWFTEDRRGTVDEINSRFPTYDTAGLTPTDEIWSEDFNETREQQLERIQDFLDSLFTDEKATCIALSSQCVSCLGKLDTADLPSAVAWPSASCIFSRARSSFLDLPSSSRCS